MNEWLNELVVLLGNRCGLTKLSLCHRLSEQLSMTYASLLLAAYDWMIYCTSWKRGNSVVTHGSLWLQSLHGCWWLLHNGAIIAWSVWWRSLRSLKYLVTIPPYSSCWAAWIFKFQPETNSWLVLVFTNISQNGRLSVTTVSGKN